MEKEDRFGQFTEITQNFLFFLSFFKECLGKRDDANNELGGFFWRRESHAEKVMKSSALLFLTAVVLWMTETETESLNSLNNDLKN